MRREVVIAIILGVGLGVLVAFGVWRANLALNSKNPLSSPQAQVLQNQDSQNSSNLIVLQPEVDSVTSTASVIVKGSATPKAIVAISTNTDNEIVQAGLDGSFEKEVSLSGGPNEIIVKSYDEQGNESQQKLTVVYSTEI